MQRILVGVDGSTAALDALRWSADLAERAELELGAARVFEPLEAELRPGCDADFHDRQLQELEKWCRSRLGEVAPVSCLLLDGDPPDALLAAASDERADLLVVGGRGAGGFPHLHLGSVAHHLTHHTTVPLAIVPRSGARPLRHLVVGLDGSPGSLAASELCADLASRLDVGVTAVYAYEPFAEWVPRSDPRSWHQHAESDVRSWAATIAQAGVPLKVKVDRDIHPVAAIARVLEAHRDAVGVVGARGIGGFGGLRLGRVPLQLVHHTGAAVVLVPATPNR
jgi:nucleotide-binding universal stress UspA family protein